MEWVDLASAYISLYTVAVPRKGLGESLNLPEFLGDESHGGDPQGERAGEPALAKAHFSGEVMR